MSDLTLIIPETVIDSAKLPKRRIESELLKELALQLYREGIVSSAGACEISHLSKAEFQFLLGEREIPQQYSSSDYEDDLANLEKWEANR